MTLVCWFLKLLLYCFFYYFPFPFSSDFLNNYTSYDFYSNLFPYLGFSLFALNANNLFHVPLIFLAFYQKASSASSPLLQFISLFYFYFGRAKNVDILALIFTFDLALVVQLNMSDVHYETCKSLIFGEVLLGVVF